MTPEQKERVAGAIWRLTTFGDEVRITRTRGGFYTVIVPAPEGGTPVIEIDRDLALALESVERKLK